MDDEQILNEFPDAFKNPTDDHVNVLVGYRIKICQQTMDPKIDKAQATGERAHERIDELKASEVRAIEDRLLLLDNKETGKVTIMWSNWTAFQKWALIYVFTALAALITPWLIPRNNTRVILGKEQLQEIVQEVSGSVLKDLRHNITVEEENHGR